MQQQNRSIWIVGALLWIMLIPLTWAEDVVVQPDSIQIGTMTIEDDASTYTIEATESDQDFYIKVMDYSTPKNAIWIDSSENAKVTTYKDLHVGDDLTVNDNATVNDDLTVGEAFSVNSDLFAVDNSISATCDFDMPDYTLNAYVVAADYAVTAENFVATDVIISLGDGSFWGDLNVSGKVTSSGGYDPPYVLYDQQSRTEVVERIQDEVPPDKQSGAALFFNKETLTLHK